MKTPNQYKVVVVDGEDGYLVASVPVLPGCHTQGKTWSELMENVKDVVGLCLDVAKDDPKYRAQITERIRTLRGKGAASKKSFVTVEIRQRNSRATHLSKRKSTTWGKTKANGFLNRRGRIKMRRVADDPVNRCARATRDVAF